MSKQVEQLSIILENSSHDIGMFMIEIAEQEIEHVIEILEADGVVLKDAV